MIRGATKVKKGMRITATAFGMGGPIGAIVLHELGHIRNRDIDQTYLAIAIWWAFVVAALLPMAVLLILRQLGPAPSLIWRAVILALHGFNDYSNAFEDPGDAWATRGIATYAYDQRGFGAAPERGLWPGRAALAADAATASQMLRRLYPGVPLYLLGDSMGGAVAVVAMTGESGTPVPDVDGVILTAPAVWGRVFGQNIKQGWSGPLSPQFDGNVGGA